MTYGGKQRMAVLALMVTLALTGIYAASANGYYFWQEREIIIKTNTAVVGAGTKTFRIRTTVSSSKIVIECPTATIIKGGVIFNGKLRVGTTEVGRSQTEVELKECKPTSTCTEVEGKIIKIPTSGNADSTVVVTPNAAGEVANLYVDTLPSFLTEITKFTLICSGTHIEVTINSEVLPKGFGELKEGQGGLLSQVDSDIAEASTEKSTHLLKYECNGEHQVPALAHNGEVELIEVDRLKYGAATACIEGELSISLESGHLFMLF